MHLCFERLRVHGTQYWQLFGTLPRAWCSCRSSACGSRCLVSTCGGVGAGMSSSSAVGAAGLASWSEVLPTMRRLFIAPSMVSKAAVGYVVKCRAESHMAAVAVCGCMSTLLMWGPNQCLQHNGYNFSLVMGCLRANPVKRHASNAMLTIGGCR